MSFRDAIGAGHRRVSTEEQIKLAIENTEQNIGPDNPGEWACLQCTFVNGHNGERCAMCLCPRMDPEPDFRPNQDPRASTTSGGMYGSEPPPPNSQPKKRTSHKAGISAAQHKRMSTEEQIALAIDQSIEAKSEEGPVEMFQRAQENRSRDSSHRRMTTEEQINRAIQMSTSEMADDDLPNPEADPKLEAANSAHRRMTTEEQISRAIAQSAEDEAQMKDMDLIDAAIELAGTARGHRRMSTEEQIARAISDNTGQDNFLFAGGVGLPSSQPAYIGGENYIQDILDNPQNHESSFHPPPGLHFGPRERALVERLIHAINENKQEINKTRVSLNQGRRSNADLKYEFEIMSDRCAQLEQDLQQAQEEIATTKAHAEELANRLDEKAVDLEDALENVVENKKDAHQREPSYVGIRELFAKDQEEVPVEEPAAAKLDHDRKPSYRGIRDMFQEQSGGKDHDKGKFIQEQESPQQGSEDPEHSKKASYGGISEVFAKGDEHPSADIPNKHSWGGGAPKIRAPSYGGIRDMFTEDDDNMDGYEDLSNAKKHDRDASYGGNIEIAEDMDMDVVKDEDNSIIDTLEEDINASVEVVWNLMVEKVHHPEKYLPVEDVAVEHCDGKWIRHMFLSSMEIVITEEIILNEEEYTIKFVDHNYPDLEIVNVLERTDNPNVQRIIFYKQNRETGMKISNPKLLQIFRTDIHFLKMRAYQKMSRSVHEREPSYGYVSGALQMSHQREPSYGGVPSARHDREVSYGGVEEQPTSNDNGGTATPGQRRHIREMSYGGIRTMFDQNDSRKLMVRLQEEVFRVMDMHPWSEITKGMVVKEVEESLGFVLEDFHKRFIKITIMRIIDGKLKLECFAGENIKREVVDAEKRVGKIHSREISYGGVQEMFEEDKDWKKKENELDEYYSRTQERELDKFYNQAQSASAQAIGDGGFEGKNKKQRDKEKEFVRKTRKHSRNVSYGGARYMETNKDEEENAEEGPEVVRVAGTAHSRNPSNQYFSLGGFKSEKGDTLEALNEEVAALRQANMDLIQYNEDLKSSKMLLVQTCSGEIERLRSLLSTVESY